LLVGKLGGWGGRKKGELKKREREGVVDDKKKLPGRNVEKEPNIWKKDKRKTSVWGFEKGKKIREKEPPLFDKKVRSGSESKRRDGA